MPASDFIVDVIRSGCGTSDTRSYTGNSSASDARPDTDNSSITYTSDGASCGAKRLVVADFMRIWMPAELAW